MPGMRTRGFFDKQDGEQQDDRGEQDVAAEVERELFADSGDCTAGQRADAETRALQYREPCGDAFQRNLFFNRLVDEERLDAAGGESAAKSVDHHRNQQYPCGARKEEHAVTDQVQNTRKQEGCFPAVEICKYAAGKLGRDHGHGIQADDQRNVFDRGAARKQHQRKDRHDETAGEELEEVDDLNRLTHAVLAPLDNR